MNRAIALTCLLVVVAGFGWTYERVNKISSRLTALIEANERGQATGEAKLFQRLDGLSADLAAVLKEQQLLSPRDLGNRRLDVRLFVIRSQLAQAQRPVVFLGDSITEAALLPSELCGRSVVNAGIGGITVSSYAENSEQILANVHAALIVIALGTNDSFASPQAAFETKYRALTTVAQKHAEHLVLVGVPPRGDGALREYLDPVAIRTNSDTIRKIAEDSAASFVGLDRLGKPGDTVDGAHLSPAGYETWHDTILNAAKRKLGCEPTEH